MTYLYTSSVQIDSKKRPNDQEDQQMDEQKLEEPKIDSTTKSKITRAKQDKKPSHSIRYDGLNHTVAHGADRQRCKYEKCEAKSSSRSYHFCSKCNVHLCSNKRNCFEKFHTLDT